MGKRNKDKSPKKRGRASKAKASGTPVASSEVMGTSSDASGLCVVEQVPDTADTEHPANAVKAGSLPDIRSRYWFCSKNMRDEFENTADTDFSEGYPIGEDDVIGDDIEKLHLNLNHLETWFARQEYWMITHEKSCDYVIQFEKGMKKQRFHYHVVLTYKNARTLEQMRKKFPAGDQCQAISKDMVHGKEIYCSKIKTRMLGPYTNYYDFIEDPFDPNQANWWQVELDEPSQIKPEPRTG